MRSLLLCLSLALPLQAQEVGRFQLVSTTVNVATVRFDGTMTEENIPIVLRIDTVTGVTHKLVKLNMVGQGQLYWARVEDTAQPIYLTPGGTNTLKAPAAPARSR